MHSISRAIAAKGSILIAIATTVAFSSTASADPTVSSDPTSLSQPTNRVVAYYLHPTQGHLMKVNQVSTIGGGVSPYSVGVAAQFNVQRVGTVQYCGFCPVQQHPIEQTFQAHYMGSETLDATNTPGQQVFLLPAVNAAGGALGSTVGQVVGALLGPEWEANRDGRLAADQAVVDGALPQMSNDLPPVDGAAYGLGALAFPVASVVPWVSRCMILGTSAAGVAGGIILLHREIWRGGNQEAMALKRTALYGAYVFGAATLLAQWLICNAEADALATSSANAAAALYCFPVMGQPVYPGCVSTAAANLYPSFRGALTNALRVYTGSLIATFVGVGVYFGF